jgi:hypothetical protein
MINTKNKQLQESPKNPPPAANAYFFVLSGVVTGAATGGAGAGAGAGAGEV